MVLLLYRPSNLQRMLLIIELATLVNHVGCLLMMESTTPETALMAVKFSYIGKPYILLAIFLFLLNSYANSKWFLNHIDISLFKYFKYIFSTMTNSKNKN